MGTVAESLQPPWRCLLTLVALRAGSWLWTWKLYVREKEMRTGQKARQALTLSMPPLVKLSSLSPGGACKGKLSALVCSCILSQTCSQLIWDVISSFKKRNPNKQKPIIFPQKEQQDGGFPVPSLAPDAVPSPAL